MNIPSSNITILDTTFPFNITKKNNLSTDPSLINNYSWRTFTSSTLDPNITILTRNMNESLFNITSTAELVPSYNSSEATQGRNETAYVATVPILSASYNNSSTVTIKSNVTLKNVSENMNMTPHPSQSYNISNGISTSNNTIPGITALHNFTLYNNFTTNLPVLNETITNRTYIVNITPTVNGTVVTQTMNENNTASATYPGSNDNVSLVTITATSTPGNNAVTATSEFKANFSDDNTFTKFPQTLSTTNNAHSFTGIFSTVPVIINTTISRKNNSSLPPVNQTYLIETTPINRTFIAMTVSPQLVRNNTLQYHCQYALSESAIFECYNCFFEYLTMLLTKLNRSSLSIPPSKFRHQITSY